MGTAYVFFADGFEEVEALAAVDVMRRAGMPVQTVTVTPSLTGTGAHGVPVVCDIDLADCDFDTASLLLLPGGLPGATTLDACEPLKAQISRFAAEGRAVAAICAAPMVLGNLGVLKGRQATCYPGFDTYLKGATYTGQLTETDGHFITGKGPGAALEFALAVVNYFCGPDKVRELRQAMCMDN